MTIEAMKQALNAMALCLERGMDETAIDRCVTATEALRAAIEQAERQEPVAWIYKGNLHPFDPSDWAEEPVRPLYPAPSQREWQTLTENEIKHLWYEACQTNLELTSQLIVHLARNIEAKLKEKNT